MSFESDRNARIRRSNRQRTVQRPIPLVPHGVTPRPVSQAYPGWDDRPDAGDDYEAKTDVFEHVPPPSRRPRGEALIPDWARSTVPAPVRERRGEPPRRSAPPPAAFDFVTPEASNALEEESVILLAESLPPEPRPLAGGAPGASFHRRATVPPRPIEGFTDHAFVLYEEPSATVILPTPQRRRRTGAGWVLVVASIVGLAVALATSVLLSP